jgi:uncharacterized protein YutE (UPF0331/DUF86 family)
MTYLVERLVELRRYLEHLRGLQAKKPDRAALDRDLSLRNDVLFSLQTICQLVIDIAGELSARRGDRFEDYTEAVRNLTLDDRFESTLVRDLERLPGFRNIIVHEYVAIDFDRVIAALNALDSVERFVAIVAEIESS